MWCEILMNHLWTFIRLVGTFAMLFMAIMLLITVTIVTLWLLSIAYHCIFKGSAYEPNGDQQRFMNSLKPDITLGELIDELSKNSNPYLYTGSGGVIFSWFDWYNIDEFHFFSNPKKNLLAMVKIRFNTGEISEIYFTNPEGSEGFVHIGVHHLRVNGVSNQIVYDENNSLDIQLTQLRKFRPISVDMTILYEIYRTLGHPVPEEIKEEQDG